MKICKKLLNMKINNETMKNLFLSKPEKYEGKNNPVTLNINANKPTKRLAIVIETLKYSPMMGIMPTMLRKVDSEKAIKNRLNVIFLSI